MKEASLQGGPFARASLNSSGSLVGCSPNIEIKNVPELHRKALLRLFGLFFSLTYIVLLPVSHLLSCRIPPSDSLVDEKEKKERNERER